MKESSSQLLIRRQIRDFMQAWRSEALVRRLPGGVAGGALACGGSIVGRSSDVRSGDPSSWQVGTLAGKFAGVVHRRLLFLSETRRVFLGLCNAFCVKTTHESTLAAKTTIATTAKSTAVVTMSTLGTGACVGFRHPAYMMNRYWLSVMMEYETMPLFFSKPTEFSFNYFHNELGLSTGFEKTYFRC